MAKGYWMAHVDVRDPEGYKGYVAAAKTAFEKYGAKFLARGGAFEELEGTGAGRNVIIEFPSLQAAHDCYHSAEYQAAKAIRQKFADAEMVLVGGANRLICSEVNWLCSGAACRRWRSAMCDYCIAAELRLTSSGDYQANEFARPATGSGV